jgi:hypothetical protein
VSRMPGYRVGPMGWLCPMHWHDEVSGQLPAAVKAYLDNRIHLKPVTRDQLELLRDYFEHYINAPCWGQISQEPCWRQTSQGAFELELAALQSQVKSLESVEDLALWLHGCMEIGIDPL